MNKARGNGISRREFARRAAIVSTATLLPPSHLPAPPLSSEFPSPQQSADAPKLSAAAQAEADARFQAIMNLYGSRFSDVQKADLRRLCLSAQPSLDRLRAYPIENADEPALYLKPLVEREKKPGVAAAPLATQESKKP